MSIAGPRAQLLHATTVALGPYAAILRGTSGAGKSDLALRFIAAQDTWPDDRLPRAIVADDQTLLSVVDGRLVASAPPSIAGRMEVRGVGIVDVPWVASADVRLVVDLDPTGKIDRLPENESTSLLGCPIPCRRLAPFEASAPLKLILLLKQQVPE